MKKYFHKENASRLVGTVSFQVYDIIAGCSYGIYSTEDPAIQAELANAASVGVTEITEAEYDALSKKKAQRFSSSTPYPSQPRTVQQVSVEDAPKPVESAKPTQTVPASVGDAVKLGKVTAPPMPSEPATTVRPANKSQSDKK